MKTQYMMKLTIGTNAFNSDNSITECYNTIIFFIQSHWYESKMKMKNICNYVRLYAPDIMESADRDNNNNNNSWYSS